MSSKPEVEETVRLNNELLKADAPVEEEKKQPKRNWKM